MRSVVFFGVIVFVLGISTAPPIMAQDSEVTPDTSVIYREVDGQTLSAHVFFPAGHNARVPLNGILLLHGGGWNAGTPQWTYAASRRFADWGMVAIAVEYRLSAGDITPIEALQDVCVALAWARQHAAELGLTDRMVGYGVSAGGQLIAATATVGCPGGEAGPDALLLWSPALDVATDGWFERMLQGRASVSEYSPAAHVKRTTPPTSIVIGAEDRLTPVSGSRRYCDQLIAFGVVCDVNVYQGVGHLLTRNLANQESDFDPDPDAVADGVERQRLFLVQLGFIADELPAREPGQR